MARPLVYAGQIDAGAIATADIGNLQVTSGKIAADAIDGSKIAADAIDGSKIADDAIVGSTVTVGDTVLAGHVVVFKWLEPGS